MTTKLLLSQLNTCTATAIVHSLTHPDARPNQTRRRPFTKASDAVVHYFTYADMMRQVGYEIQYNIHRPWTYDVVMGQRVVEMVRMELPS